MTRFSNAVYSLMMKRRVRTMSSRELWQALCEEEPQLTMASATRKTPRSTAMRDLRRDPRFIVRDGTISLAAPTNQ
jgi:hypothetical protein